MIELIPISLSLKSGYIRFDMISNGKIIGETSSDLQEEELKKVLIITKQVVARKEKEINK